MPSGWTLAGTAHLEEIASESHREGDAYYQPREALHLARSVGDTVTLVVQGPVAAGHTDVFCRGENDAHRHDTGVERIPYNELGLRLRQLETLLSTRGSR